MKHLKGILHGVKNSLQGLSSLGDSEWFSKGILECLVLVNLVVKLKLESVLTSFDEEITDCLWNRVSDASKADTEVSVDLFSHSHDLRVSSILLRVSTLAAVASTWSTRSTWATWPSLTMWILSHLSLLSIFLLLEVIIISKMIINLGINNSFNDFSSVISLFLENFGDDVHYFTNHGWESLENLLDDTGSNLLQHTVGVLDEFESWLLQLLELRADEIDEDIDTQETGKTITFVHLDGSADVHVIILRSSTVSIEFRIQIIIIHLQLGTTSHLSVVTTTLHLSLGVVSSRDGIFI